MPIINHVTSLELSRRLKELGVPQKSCFYHVRISDTLDGRQDWLLRNSKWGKASLEEYSAYLASELDKIIADATNGDYAFITNEELTMGYHVYEPIIEIENLKLTRTGYKLEVIESAGVMDENPANCRAKMLIYLIKNHLISVEELGK